MTLAYFVDGESAAPEDGDYDISQVMETSMWDSFVVEGWEIDRLFFVSILNWCKPRIPALFVAGS